MNPYAHSRSRRVEAEAQPQASAPAGSPTTESFLKSLLNAKLNPVIALAFVLFAATSVGGMSLIAYTEISTGGFVAFGPAVHREIKPAVLGASTSGEETKQTVCHNNICISLPVAEAPNLNPPKMFPTSSPSYGYGGNPLPILGKSVSSCGQITGPGSYTLTKNLTAPANSSCISAHDTSNVVLNCQNHSITTDVSQDLASDSPPVLFSNVNGFTLKSCNIITLNSTAGSFLYPLVVQNSPNGTVVNNTFGEGINSVSNSPNFQFSKDISASGIQTFGSDNVKITGNTITTSELVGWAGVVVIDSSTGGQVTDNNLNGGWNGVEGNELGSDDGIIFGGVTQLTVQNNSISNIWDCGIENEFLADAEQLLNNSIKNAGTCGIGGWYGSSWENSTISNNTVDTANLMFMFFRLWGLQPGEQNIYFQNNIFTNNKFLNARANAATYASYFDFADMPDGVATSSVIASNNIFTRNDFGTTLAAPWFTPSSMIVDGGGNICAAPSGPGSYPIVCNRSAAVTLSPSVVNLSMNVGNYQSASGSPVSFNIAPDQQVFWKTASSASWISVSATGTAHSGSSANIAAASGANSLAPGSYSGTVTFSAVSAKQPSFSPQTVTVNLLVISNPVAH